MLAPSSDSDDELEFLDNNNHTNTKILQEEIDGENNNQPPRKDTLENADQRRQTLSAELKLAITYTATDIASRPRNFTIGFCSTFVVVFFVGLILVGISKTPVIFLRFAETSVGEMDALLLAGGGTPFLNYTEVAPRLSAESELTEGSTPRWLLRGQLYAGDPSERETQSSSTNTNTNNTQTTSSTSNTNSSSSNINTTSTTTAAPSSSPSSRNVYVGTSILIGDTKREQELGIGRGWPYRRIGYAEVQALDTILSFLGVPANQGDRTSLIIDVAGILREQGIDPNEVLGAFGAGAGGGTIDPQGAAGDNTTVTVPDVEPNTTVTVAGANGTTTNLTAEQIFQGLAALGGANLTQQQSADLVTAANAFAQAQGANGTFNISEFINGLPPGFLPSTGDIAEQLLAPEMGLTVADGFDDPYGKYPGSLGNMILLDQRYFVKALLNQLCYSTLRQPFGADGFTAPGLPPVQELESSFRLDDFALIIVAMMRNRFEIYYSGTTERTQRITRFSNDLFRALGLGFLGEAQYPIAIALVGFDFFSLFLSSLFTSIVAVIIVMGFLLVYTLLLTNTEERSFEVAMLRAQGMNKTQLFLLLASQSTAFIVPSLILAVAVLLGVNALLEVIMSSATVAPPDTSRIDPFSIIFPVCIGIFIPIVANYKPAKSIMSTALRDALSVYRHAANETTVSVMRLAELGLAPWQTLVGWLLVIGGFIVYYLIPLSFIFEQLSMFFVLMNLILLGMLLGLCLITFTIQETMERFVLWCLLWGKDKCLNMLVKKNLAAHADRNSKAFLMFTVTSACIIFGGSLFTLLAISISDTVKTLNGADIDVRALTSNSPLNKSSIDAFLTDERDNFGTVHSWSYATFSITEFPQASELVSGFVRGGARISTVIGFPSVNLQIQAVDENFQDTVFSQFALLYSKDENVKYEQVQDPYDSADAGSYPNVVKSLYTVPPISLYEPVGEVYTGFPPNQTRPNIFVKYSSVIPVMYGSAAESVLGLDSGSAGTLAFAYKIGSGVNRVEPETVFLSQTRCLWDKLPGFPTLTNLQVTFRSSIVLTSMDGFRSLLNANEFDFGADEVARNPNLQLPADAIKDPNDGLGRLWIRLRPGMSEEQRSDFANRLRLVLNPYFHLAIDTAEVVGSVKTASDLILYFFYFVSVVAIILDTFMLWLTFISNIQLNSWSVGVLRSLGFTANQVTRAYVYEALVLVLGSFICGTIIGLLVAVTVILQMSILLTLPFQMNFPTSLFFLLLALSVFSAFAASILPARAINQRPISLVLKKG